jgi:hypothetical protein
MSCSSSDSTETVDTSTSTSVASESTTTIDASDDTVGVTPIPSSALNDTLATIPSVSSLSVTDRDALIWMREEEKVAHDVYVTLAAKWGANVFTNISGAEQTHTDAVETLLVRYSIKDPVTDTTVGVFNSKVFADLYTDLVKKGSTSLADAYVVGAIIEDLDIKDLQDRSTKTPDIALVFDNLEKGSRNHMRAFIRQLDRLGLTYTPSHISQAEYDAIISGSMEQGLQN